MTFEQRIHEIVHIAYQRLCAKLMGGLIVVDNEASLQLQLACILKALGELYVDTPNETFNIELEKTVLLNDSTFVKSRSKKANIDIWIALENVVSREKYACAFELKYFKKANQREPNNRYDVFKDISNLERYGAFANTGFLLVATDHAHYVTQDAYKEDTADFDFRDGRSYLSGTELIYNKPKPYGPPITLKGNYQFKWHHAEQSLSFLLLPVNPCKYRL